MIFRYDAELIAMLSGIFRSLNDTHLHFMFLSLCSFDV